MDFTFWALVRLRTFPGDRKTGQLSEGAGIHYGARYGLFAREDWSFAERTVDYG
jgi:hypothetical protein